VLQVHWWRTRSGIASPGRRSAGVVGARRRRHPSGSEPRKVVSRTQRRPTKSGSRPAPASRSD